MVYFLLWMLGGSSYESEAGYDPGDFSGIFVGFEPRVN